MISSSIVFCVLTKAWTERSENRISYSSKWNNKYFLFSKTFSRWLSDRV